MHRVAQFPRNSAPEGPIPRVFLPRVGPIFGYFSTGGMGREFQTSAELLIRSLASDARCSGTISLQQRAREEESPFRPRSSIREGVPSLTWDESASVHHRAFKPPSRKSATLRHKRESPGASLHRGFAIGKPSSHWVRVCKLPKRNPVRTNAGPGSAPATRART